MRGFLYLVISIIGLSGVDSCAFQAWSAWGKARSQTPPRERVVSSSPLERETRVVSAYAKHEELQAVSDKKGTEWSVPLVTDETTRTQELADRPSLKKDLCIGVSLFSLAGFIVWYLVQYKPSF